MRNENASVIRAKQAISSYKKALGGAAGFCDDVGYQDESYFNALVGMFEQAIGNIVQLPVINRSLLIARLDKVRTISANFG